ncbi:MAG: heparinase II/III family protein [Devosiaceae bacterium]
MGRTFWPIQSWITGIGARGKSVGRGIGASLSTAFVGTWSSRKAVFESVPRELRTADPTRAIELIEGYIALADKVVELNGRSLFQIDPPSENFAKALHSFEWLRHIRAYELRSSSPAQSRQIAARIAREYTMSWINNQRKHPHFAHLPVMAARRALSLTNHAAFLLDDAPPHEYRAIMAAIMHDTQSAFTHRAQISDPSKHCFVVVACACVAYALGDHIAIKQFTRDALNDILKKTFNAEGGPVTRRPADLALLMPELLALQALITTRNLPQPANLAPAITAGLRMLRMLRHPDGSLARFHGTQSIKAFQSDLVASVLVYDVERTAVPALAPITGYARLEAEQSLVLVDCGSPPAPDASSQAHASALAFEWSFASTKIITNAAEIGYTVDADIMEQRTTAAHSTLVANGQSSTLLARRQYDAALLVDGLTVAVDKLESGSEPRIELRHTGYQQRLGLDHWRSLALSSDGRTLEGHDRLLLASGAVANGNRPPYAIHFQLQPGARVMAEGDRRLRISMRHQGIIFEADQGTVQVINPCDRPSYRGPHPALRIIVHGEREGTADITWRFVAQHADAGSKSPD